MKIIFLLFAAFSFSLISSAQSHRTIKLYGFKQFVSGGKAPEMDKDSELRKSAGAGKNYFLYAVAPTRIYPSEIWIEGTQYGVTMRSISNTPVEYSDAANIGSAKKVLVPKTTQKVLQLLNIPHISGKLKSSKAKKLSEENELVLVYKMNGKFYYDTMKKLDIMDDAVMQ